MRVSSPVRGAINMSFFPCPLPRGKRSVSPRALGHRAFWGNRGLFRVRPSWESPCEFRSSQSYQPPRDAASSPQRPKVTLSVPFKGSKESNELGTARPKSNRDVPTGVAGLVFPDLALGVSPGPLRLRYRPGSPHYMGPGKRGSRLKGGTAQGTPGFGKMGRRATPLPVPFRCFLSLHLGPDPWPRGTIGKMFKERRDWAQEGTHGKTTQSIWPGLKASNMQLRT